MDLKKFVDTTIRQVTEGVNSAGQASRGDQQESQALTHQPL